jgi:hypothetical protein
MKYLQHNSEKDCLNLEERILDIRRRIKKLNEQVRGIEYADRIYRASR